jgi:hypothetical protein
MVDRKPSPFFHHNPFHEIHWAHHPNGTNGQDLGHLAQRPVVVASI